MRVSRQLLEMAGLVPTPQQRALKRHERQLNRHRRGLAQEAALVDMISRRERGESGTQPMPYQELANNLARMAKGEI